MDISTLLGIFISASVPFVIFQLTGNRAEQSRQKETLLLLSDKLHSLDAQLLRTQDSILNVDEKLKYRSKIASIKYQAVADEIKDIKGFLAKTTAFQPRVSRIAPSDTEDTLYPERDSYFY